ncbi:MAG: capsule assembly Wzi family protein [Gemmatimonadaceae bacterium]
MAVALSPLVAVTLQAQPAATIPASSTLYDRLEAVSAFFPVRGLFLGERALSRREVQRIVASLSTAIDSVPPQAQRRAAWARRELEVVLSALNEKRDMKVRGGLRAGFAWRGDVVSSNALEERIEPNGLGSIDAVTHPFAQGRYGWPTPDGTAATLAPRGVFGAGDWFAAAAQVSGTLTSEHEDGWISERFLQRGYLRGVFHNVGAHLGMEEQRWGQSPRGSLFISGNAMPFPSVSLSTDTAITLPWVLRHAGRTRGVLFISDLGGTQVPPHARLVGWQASIQPWSRFELGVAVTAQMGGNGGPPATFFQRVVDLLPLIDALAPQHADLQISNKLAGGNLRLRFPELSGTDLYYELQIDDFDGRRLRSSFVDDAAHLVGVRVPILLGDGLLAWRGEWHYTSLRLYEHGQFRSGSTYRQRIIGNPLGPHAMAGLLAANWQPTPARNLELSAALESRDPSQYTVVTSGPNDRGFTFVRLTNDPSFRRLRINLSLDQLLPGGALRVMLGHNQASRTGQASRHEWFGLLSLNSQRLTTF